MGTPSAYFASATGAAYFTWTPSGHVSGSDLCLNANCSQFYIEWDWFGPYMEVTASNSCGTSDPFNSWNYCRLSNEALSVEVYPNPTSGVAAIDFGSKTASTYALEVTDLAGRIIIEKEVAANVGLNQAVIDLTSSGKGMYFVTLTGSDGSKVTRRLAVE
jgi:hypothetical protein